MKKIKFGTSPPPQCRHFRVLGLKYVPPKMGKIKCPDCNTLIYINNER